MTILRNTVIIGTIILSLLVRSPRVYAQTGDTNQASIPDQREIRIITAVDRLMLTSDKITTYANHLAALIATAKASGKDVTRLKVVLTDMRTKLTDAKEQQQALVTALSVLTPTPESATNATTFQTAQTQLKTSTQDLKAAFQDGLQLRQALKAAKIFIPTE